MQTAATALLGDADGQQAAFGLVLWFGGVVLAVLSAIIVLAYLRRRLRGSSPTPDSAFALGDIKGMRNRGELSSEEYDALRRRLLDVEAKSTNGG